MTIQTSRNILKISLLGLLLVFCSYIIPVSAQTESLPDYPVDTINGQLVYRYTVEKSEGLYRISIKFDVSQDEIIRLNPSIQKEGLKYGQKIYIPVKTKSEPIDTVKYIYHVIQPKETLYSLSRRYGISVKQIEQLNPDLVPNLPYGRQLRIPRNSNTEKAERQMQEELQPQPKSEPAIKSEPQPEQKLEPQQEAELQPESKQETKPEPELEQQPVVQPQPTADTTANQVISSALNLIDSIMLAKADTSIVTPSVSDTVQPLPIIPLGDGFPTDFINLQDSTEQIPMRVAYLLPLMLDATKRDANIDRFLEFYEGSLLALNDLQRQGLKIETYAFDIEKNDISLMAVLQKPELKNIDAIIGPAYPAQVLHVARFAKQERIPTIVPFTSNVQGLDTNEYVLRFNLSPLKEAEIMAQYIADNKFDFNVVYIDTEDNEGGETMQLLVDELKKNKVTVPTIKIGSLKSSLKKGKENILIFKSTKRQDIQPYMDELISLSWDFEISVVGQYGWSKSEMPLKMYYVSVFDAEDLLKQDIYNQEFNRYYNYQLSNTRPRYDMLGYDITVYTFRLLFENQVNNKQNIPMREIITGIDYHGIQSDIHFYPTTPNGGFTNIGHVVVREADR